MIYTITTENGGVGKTTTAAALTQAAAYKGKRALAIDLDPQGHLSLALAADATQPGSYDLLHGTPAGELIQHSPQGLDVIPASPNLKAEKSEEGTARRLQHALEPIKSRYDAVFIDTPASAGELQLNALQAADRLILMCEADPYSAQSFYQSAETSRRMMKSNPRLKYAGLIIARYCSNPSKIDQFWRAQLQQQAEALKIPYLGEIRAGQSPIREAVSFKRSLFEYAPRSNQAADYLKIYELLTE